MAVFDHPSFDQHEDVVFYHDPETDLKAIIAIHDTTLGPAVGGCRLWHYQDDTEALEDVLRLSRGMTYKNAIAQLPFGGGKSVILKPDHITDRTALFKSFGKMVERLQGRYYSAEDIGTNTTDIMNAYSETSYMFGLEGKSGDPSPITAIGVIAGMEAALMQQRGDPSMKNIKVAVQGVGHVGYYICKALYEAGASIIVSDIDAEAITRVVHEFNAVAVAPDLIYQQDVDIFSPCALGGIINDQTIKQLKAKIVAGSANNQLQSSEHGQALFEQEILYAPDYVINAGGIINVSFEKNYQREKAIAQVKNIGPQLELIFEQSKARQQSTSAIADDLARDIIKKSR